MLPRSGDEAVGEDQHPVVVQVAGGGDGKSEGECGNGDISDASSRWRGSDPSGHETVCVPASICSEEEMTSFPRVHPDKRVDVVFEDLEVQVRASVTSKEKKTILHNVSGRFRAGELIAVMGPSGAGKTTLLNTISGYSAGNLSGGKLNMLYHDGREVSDRHVCCYLTQDDHVQTWFTAREIVMQAANLKVGSSLSSKARGVLVDEILEALGLYECRNTRSAQLSGGQRKRLAIAAELVDNPTVLFFDEPTSGLDTSTATQCATLMRQMARSGRAIICTIHQPSENLLSLFDQVYVLAQGYCVYRGPPSNILPFLSNLGYLCPKFHNPADFLMEVANNEYGYAVDVMANEVLSKSSEYPPPLPEIKYYETGKVKQNGHKGSKLDLLATKPFKPSEWDRFCVLVTRSLLQQHRDWVTTHIKLLAAISVALILGLKYGNLGDNADRVISNVGLLFILSLYIHYTPEAPAVLKFPDEISIVKREWFNHWYSLNTYTLALLVSSLPMHVMTSTALCSITYYMTGQIAEPLRFAQVTLIVILTSLCAETIGLQFGSLFLKKKIISLFIASIHLAYCILFSGFLALKPEMPEWFTWAARLNHLHYTINGLVVALYRDRSRLSCPEEEIYCHLREPSLILDTFGLSDVLVWHCIVALILIVAILRTTVYLSLSYNLKRVDV